MNFATADLYDQHEHRVQVLEPMLSDFGGERRFSGPIATVKVFEDNSLVRAALEEPGAGKVLVVDGGGSLRCALIGDKLAELARRNGWAGLVVYGCIRDAAAIATIPIGLKAVNTTPRKSVKQGAGDRDISVQFAGVTFKPDWFLYADEDGVLVSEQPLA